MEHIRSNFCSQFLRKQELLKVIIEQATGHTVDKLLVVTFVLDENADEVFECIFLSNNTIQHMKMTVSMEEK